MVEKSGIQMLKEMQQKLDLLERRFANLEFMVKELLGRTNEKSIQTKPMISAITEVPKVNEQLNIEQSGVEQTKPSIKIGDPPVNAPPINPNNKIKVIGQIKNKEGRYISGVNVKILDMNNQIIKNTKTNRAGEWMSLVPFGKYKAEYFLENIIDTSVSFNALPGQTMVRVAQPVQKEG